MSDISINYVVMPIPGNMNIQRNCLQAFIKLQITRRRDQMFGSRAQKSGWKLYDLCNTCISVAYPYLLYTQINYSFHNQWYSDNQVWGMLFELLPFSCSHVKILKCAMTLSRTLIVLQVPYFLHKLLLLLLLCIIIVSLLLIILQQHPQSFLVV